MPAWLKNNHRLQWMNSEHIKPYVYIRPENKVLQPGTAYALDWFNQEPLHLNPLKMQNVEFADQILRIENKAFEASGIPMPRWVFYDCAIMPGFVCGFAIKKSQASSAVLKIVESSGNEEWIPLSLFVIIPTMSRSNEWVAHNLSSINSLLPKELQFYGLGFLSKAFGLWYANIETCCGMTQWRSPSIRLHSHYGDFEVLTAFTPVHSYAQTLTYRLKVKPMEWERFFTQEKSPAFDKKYVPAGFYVDPKDESSLISFQNKLESQQGPFFLDSNEVRSQPLDAKLAIYSLRR